MALERKQGTDSPEAFKMRREIKMNEDAAFAFLASLSAENDWHYAGASVRLYTPGKPVFWYRPASARYYRVICADVNIKELALEAFQFPYGPPSKPLGDNQFEVTFSYRPYRTVKSVSLVGSFNKWKPTANKMDGPDKDGRFTTALKLKKGTYEYQFVLDGNIWESDPNNIWQRGHNAMERSARRPSFRLARQTARQQSVRSHVC